jgi:hypothetical protein
MPQGPRPGRKVTATPGAEGPSPRRRPTRAADPGPTTSLSGTRRVRDCTCAEPSSAYPGVERQHPPLRCRGRSHPPSSSARSVIPRAPQIQLDGAPPVVDSGCGAARGAASVDVPPHVSPPVPGGPSCLLRSRDVSTCCPCTGFAHISSIGCAESSQVPCARLPPQGAAAREGWPAEAQPSAVPDLPCTVPGMSRTRRAAETHRTAVTHPVSRAPKSSGPGLVRRCPIRSGPPLLGDRTPRRTGCPRARPAPVRLLRRQLFLTPRVGDDPCLKAVCPGLSPSSATTEPGATGPTRFSGGCPRRTPVPRTGRP